MFIALLVLGVLLTAIFLFSGARKVAGGDSVRDEAAHLGVPLAGYRAIGVAEAGGAGALLVGLAWAPLGMAAAAGFVVLTVGATVAHLRVADPVGRWAPAVVIAVAASAALWLRIATA